MRTSESFQPVKQGYSPWGTIQSLTVLAPGIISVSTAGHGGIWISAEREARVPAEAQAAARQYAPRQWYEEDCDVCIVGVIFADDLSPNQGEFIKHCRDYVMRDPRMASVRSFVPVTA